MSFVLQRVTDHGLVLSQVTGDVLRLGRGTNADLRSENPAVALEHAVIETDAAGYSITDKGSITGTYVNRRPVESSRLGKGDVIELGDLRIEVQFADPGRPLFLRVVSTATARPKGQRAPDDIGDEDDEAQHLPAGAVVKAPKIDYVSAFRLRRQYLTKASLIGLLMIVSLLTVAELTQPENQAAFMPGGVSSAHARTPAGESAKDCQKCHSPWRGVVDAQCRSCHFYIVPHAEAQSEAPSCTSCHMEHRGALKLSQMSDAPCRSCHADLRAHVKSGTELKAAVFHIDSLEARHPEFTLPADEDTLRFNHQLHLQAGGIRNGAGKREALQCVTCHALQNNGGELEPRPVSFATDCQRCHKLTFDIRLPDAEVPHGLDPGSVTGFIAATFGGNRDLVGKAPDEIRRILTARPPVRNDESAFVAAEQVIKTKCTKCHEIGKVAGRSAVTRPVIRTHWIQHTRFTHTKHQDCESCHEAARRSAKTSDVLMPSQKDCVRCHGARDGKPSDTCVKCHEYHEMSKKLPAKWPKTLPGGGGGMLETILIYAIVALLAVVLIPVGLALYQRLRVQTEQSRVAAQRTPAPAPPPPPPPLVPSTVKVPAVVMPSSPSPPATPRPPAVTPHLPPPSATGDSTRIVLEGDRGASRPESTELVQWYGMLQCSSGPLEGQHFIIDDDGFYIGRDALLAKVTIADSRVSKRHVRIVPRDGKVWAIDQNSTNGTFLAPASGARQRITEVQLKRGDAIILADNVATFIYQI